MAAFEEHCRDCERLLGNRCEPVHKWLDELMAKFGGLHRFARHHLRGAEQAGELFGELGKRAALVHILKDCGWVPKDRDWKERKVDSLGFKVGSYFNGYWDPKEFTEAAKKVLGVPD